MRDGVGQNPPNQRDQVDSVNYVKYDQQGRITGSGRGERKFLSGPGVVLVDDALSADGSGKAQLDATFQTAARMRVDVSSAVPVLVPRQAFPGTLSPDAVPAGAEATVRDLPACTVRYTGPISGTHEHAGGNVAIGFTVPGTYKIEVDPYPYLSASFDLVVGDGA